MRLAILSAVLAGIAIAVGAVPAFTADSGSVGATVTVPPPPAPCLTVSVTSVDFGTLEFSDPAASGTPRELAAPSTTVRSCSTAPEYINVRGSTATTASGGVWSPLRTFSTVPANTCTLGSNRHVLYAVGTLLNLQLDTSFRRLASTPFNPGVGSGVGFEIKMPCRGSAGAGETASMTFSFLAVLA